MNKNGSGFSLTTADDIETAVSIEIGKDGVFR